MRVQSAKEPSPPRKPLVSATPVPDFQTIHKRNAKKMQKAKIAAEDERSRRPKSAAPSKIAILSLNLILRQYGPYYIVYSVYNIVYA